MKKIILSGLVALAISAGLMGFFWSNQEKPSSDTEKRVTSSPSSLPKAPSQQIARYFDTYAQTQPGTEAAYQALVDIYKLNFTTDTDIERLRGFVFDKSRSLEERIILTRAYSDIIKSANPDWVRRIRADLEEIVKTTDEQRLGLAGIFGVTRTLSSDDSDELFMNIVKLGLDKGFLVRDEYSGELVHRAFVGRYLSPDFAPLIYATKDSAYGMDLFNSYLADPAIALATAQKFDKKSYATLLAFVKENEPHFPEYGVSHAIEYASWVAAYASLQAALAPDMAAASRDAFIQIFTQPNQAPVNLIALLSFPQNQDIVLSAARAGNTDVIHAINRTQAFVEGHKDDLTVHNFYDVIAPVLNYKEADKK